MENSQLHSTLEASAAVETKFDTIKDDLEEERKMRKGLQERLRVILEELEGIKDQNADLQSQLSKTNFLNDNLKGRDEESEKKSRDLEGKFSELLEESKKKVAEQAEQVDKLEKQNRELLEGKREHSTHLKALKTEIQAKSEIVINLESRYAHLRQVFNRFIENPYERVF